MTYNRNHPGEQEAPFLPISRSAFAVVLTIGLAVVVNRAGTESNAQTPAQPTAAMVVDGDTFRTAIQPFLKRHCVKCHGSDKSEGDLRLDNLPADFVNRPASDHWIEVLDRINLGEMPPEDEPKPTAESLDQVATWLTRELTAARARSESTGGRVVLRRLSRLEYANTVRDLLHVAFVDGEGPIDLLPPDGVTRGFNKNSKSLLVDPSLMESYFAVASKVADQAIRFRPPAIPERTMKFEFRDTEVSAMSYLLQQRTAYLEDGKMVMLGGSARTFGKLYHPYSQSEIPVSGRYRVRVKAAAEPGAANDPVYMDVRQGPADRIARFRVDARPNDPKIYEFITTRDQNFNGEFSIILVDPARLDEFNQRRGHQQREAQALFDKGKLLEFNRYRARLRAQGDTAMGNFRPEALDLSKAPRLHLDWIEVTGPLQGEYPPESMKQLFFDGWEAEKRTTHYIEQIFTRLLPRAFRRPVSRQEVHAIVRLVTAEMEAGSDFEEAMKAGLVATLCAPDFLYIFEPSAPTEEPRRLNDFELASRLSYFLWSSKPDDALFRQAAQGQLRQPALLEKAVDRLIADPHSEGLVQGFARQWLKVDEFQRFLPDEEIFPDFYRTELLGLEHDLVEQPLAVFREMLASNAPLVQWLDADWTMVNERLAKHYHLPDVQGETFQRIKLPTRADWEPKKAGLSPETLAALTTDQQQRTATQQRLVDELFLQQSTASVRGGLLGMAGVHLWGADGSRTKPVERGKYILDVLFNDPPPPPPPNAGEVEPNVRGENLTVRERLQRHREQTTCNNCHRRIDPYGLALENFNVISQWRTQQDGEKPLNRWRERRPIDPSGTLPNGREFTNLLEFRKAIVEQSPRFQRGLAEKMLSYALGRTIEPTDRGEIDTILAQTSANGGTLSALLHAVVAAPSFQLK